MTIEQIQKLPTVIQNNHESLYQSYQALEYILDMVKRGDSKETILEGANVIRNGSPKTVKIEDLIITHQTKVSKDRNYMEGEKYC